MKFKKLIAICFPILFIFVCTFLTGCNETNGEVGVNEPDNADNPPSAPTTDISGTWTGTISGYGETITATMTIAQAGESVTGTYILDHNGDTDEGTVTGAISNGAGTFTFTSGGGTIAEGNFVFSGETATGTFTYGNLTLNITLTRS
jgi:hypothetical protein